MAEAQRSSDPLSLSRYVIEKEKLVSLGLNLDFKDDSGNVVILTKAKVLVTRQTLETPDGKVLCTITHKTLSITPAYEVHDGDDKGKVTAVIKQTFNISSFVGVKNIEITDQSGQVIANAKGNFLNYEYNITSSDGTSVAEVSRNIGSGWGSLMDAAKSRYAVNITDSKKLPTLTILAFLVVVEILAHQQSGNRGGGGLIGGLAGGALGGGLGGGFGGGQL